MDVRVGLWRKLSAEELMLLNFGVGEDSWESLGLQGDPTSPFWRSTLEFFHCFPIYFPWSDGTGCHDLCCEIVPNIDAQRWSPVCMHAQSLQLYLTLWGHLDCGPPGSSVHGILQARTVEWVAMPSSRGSSQPRDQTRVSHLPALFFTTNTIWEAPVISYLSL